ncbi:circadian-associated transcriptional repressor [Platysternon megacephalum]|uniref:Circadian-associated transcriptional repressor n=1 Tax=Platysternon megacephalum TaxID=55544 RepID=A0A4D9DKC7_9SAUR|nr:circadian-associated transcriptional repressor [Platysternon megacephalum]
MGLFIEAVTCSRMPVMYIIALQRNSFCGIKISTSVIFNLHAPCSLCRNQLRCNFRTAVTFCFLCVASEGMKTTVRETQLKLEPEGDLFRNELGFHLVTTKLSLIQRKSK